jgi:hypothetical protein
VSTRIGRRGIIAAVTVAWLAAWCVYTLEQRVEARVDDCALLCEDDPHCPYGYHDAWDPPIPGLPPEVYRAGGAHPVENNCWTGTCAMMHGYCAEFAAAESLEELRAAILAENASLLRSIVAEEKVVSVNAARSAIQVRSACTGSVIAHLPVPRSLIAAIRHGA